VQTAVIDPSAKVTSLSTPGFSGADLANLINEAAIVAVRDDRYTISAADFSEARDRILLGRREATNALMLCSPSTATRSTGWSRS